MHLRDCSADHHTDISDRDTDQISDDATESQQTG